MGLLYGIETALNVWRHRVHAMRKGPIGAWFRDNGEELMWRDLPITAKDVCLDVGGYRGDWTAELLVRYGAPSIVFEAVPAFADKIAERFTHNTLVTVRAAAIGTRTGKGEIALADDGSSFHGAGPPLSIDVIDVAEVFTAHPLIGCMKLNIEGAEYDLLERMAELNLLDRVATYRIQFHGGENAVSRRQAIQERLSRTHVSVIDYPFVWERWDRRRVA